MTWNYRIMKKKNSEGSFEYGIYEVYYDENGNVSSWAKESLTPVCMSSDDLQYEKKVMMEAFKKDTLEYKEKEK